MNNRKIGAVIATAGLSTRMKDFKPVLEIGSATIIEQTVKNFQNIGAHQIIVVTGHNGDLLEEKLAKCNITFVKNELYETSYMFDSICIGLKAMREEIDYVFLTPADSPFVQLYTLSSMITEMEKGETSLIQPSFEGRNGHPLLLNKDAVKKVLDHDGTMGLRGVAAKINSKNMTFVDSGIIMDADTPLDYFKLIEYYEGKTCPSADMCMKIQDYFCMPEKVKAHCARVAMTALDICRHLSEKGIEVNKKTVIASSLLHDIAKGHKGHAEIGSKWLKDMGYYDISNIVEEHMELKTVQNEITEKEVVYLADKLVKGDERSTIEERFSEKEKLYKGDKEALEAVKYKKEQAYEVYDLIFK